MATTKPGGSGVTKKKAVAEKSKGELTANQQASLKVLAKLPKSSQGITRKQLQGKIGKSTTGYPQLIKLGLVIESVYPDSGRTKFYKASAKGKATAAKL